MKCTHHIIAILGSLILCASYNFQLRMQELTFNRGVALSLCRLTESRFQVSATREAYEFLRASIDQSTSMVPIVLERNIPLSSLPQNADSLLKIPCSITGRNDIEVYFFVTSPYSLQRLITASSLAISLVLTYLLLILVWLITRRLTRLRAQLAVSEAAAALAHDVRAPLRMLEAKLDEVPTDEQSINLIAGLRATIASSRGKINELIDDVLLAQGSISLEKKSFPLHQLLEDALEEVRYSVKEPERDVRLQCNSQQMIYADRSKLHRVFINLLSNAFAFSSPSDLVAIVVSEKNNAVNISISNTGSFIPFLQRLVIFRFGKTTRSHGHGLGVAICAKIIQRHGGSIRCYSDRSKGTSFVVSLKKSYEDLPVATRPAKKTRVFLVEDDPFCRDRWTAHYRNEITVCLTVFDCPSDFLENLTSKKLSLTDNDHIVTDMYFDNDPKWNGNLLAEYLRKQKHTGKITLCSDSIDLISPAFSNRIKKDDAI